MSDKEKQIEINGKKFTVKKFTPQLGCYWVFQLLGSLASGMDGKGMMSAVQSFMQMTPDRFQHFQADCLKSCYFQNSNGLFSLMNQNGSMAYPGELTGPELFQLTTHAFMYTLMDFLDPALLEGLGSEMSMIFPQTGKETSSTSQSPKGTGNKKNSGTAPTP
jgi:hypothetical protein